MRPARKQKAYARAGVDVDLGNRLKGRIQQLVTQTHGPQVLGTIGGFGGLFRANSSGMREPVLVASIDGVGTRLKIAFAFDLPGTIGEELLRVHKNYQPLLAKVPSGMIKGLAHITGGGLIDNLPRILPKKCDAIIETRSWRVPRIFQMLQRNGDVDSPEMYQV